MGLYSDCFGWVFCMIINCNPCESGGIFEFVAELRKCPAITVKCIVRSAIQKDFAPHLRWSELMCYSKEGLKPVIAPFFLLLCHCCCWDVVVSPSARFDGCEQWFSCCCHLQIFVCISHFGWNFPIRSVSSSLFSVLPVKCLSFNFGFTFVDF